MIAIVAYYTDTRKVSQYPAVKMLQYPSLLTSILLRMGALNE